VFCLFPVQSLGEAGDQVKDTMTEDYMSRDGLYIIILVLIFIGLSSCADRIASSTDNHNRVPQVNCTMIKFEGHMQEMCCEENHCVLTE
jgi:hypothetical protein